MGSPGISLEQQGASAVLPPVHTKLEYELRVRNPVAYQTLDPISVSSLVNEVPRDPFSL